MESIGVIVAIAYAVRQSSIKEIEQFHVITRCESRLNLLIREDPNSEKIGFCLHATAYFCHPGFRGYLLSTDLEFKVIAEDGLKMLLARRQKEGFKVTETNVTECLKLMLDFAYLQDVSWTMRYGSKELIDIDPIMYWGSYITNPFIGLPIKTAHQWGLFKNCMLELFGMWITTASLERAFSMGKQLAPPQKSRIKVSTTASHLLIKTHFMLYREKRERCRSSKIISIEFDATSTLNEILEELDVEESTSTDEEINERTLRHELRGLKLWNIEGNSPRFPSKLSKLVPTSSVLQEYFSSESSESADLTHF